MNRCTPPLAALCALLFACASHGGSSADDDGGGAPEGEYADASGSASGEAREQTQDAASDGAVARADAGAPIRDGGRAVDGGRTVDGGDAGRGSTSMPGSDAGACSGPIGAFSGALASGIAFMDDRGKRVNAHGGGIIQEGDTYYLHGEFFSDASTDNNFNGFAMYSSRDLASWKWEKMILPQQPNGLLGPKRKGERPHIIKCPSTGEFVLYAHAASEDYQSDKEVVYATSATVNGDYTFVGALTNASGQTAAHSDMSAISDGDKAYVVTESGHVYTLAPDCHSFVSDKAYSAVNGDSGGSESPTVFKAGNTYYWIGSYKTGWRANNNFYSTAPSINGPWTHRGFLAPVSDAKDNISAERTWLSQSTWVTPVRGCDGTVYVYWGDHWDGTEDTKAPGKHNYLATYVFQPLVFTDTAISLPSYHSSWKLDVGAGTWSE